MARNLDRRGALAAIGMAACLPAVARAALSEDARLIARARQELVRHATRISRTDTVGIADFSRPSSQPRFHLVDMATGAVSSLLVAHGRGSDPGHSGWLKRFSNEPGSAATSEGAYLTADHYIGKHGPSMRLIGLDATNNNAQPRAIVVHGAWYVGPKLIASHGMIGRSEGCFAFAEWEVGKVMERLGPGRLLVAMKA